jgi:hypothetical protein
VVPLRPLGLGELLDGAVTLVRRYPRPTLGLSAAIALVTTLLNVPLLLTAAGSPLLDGSALEPGSDVDLDGAVGAVVAGFGASALLTFLTGVVLTGVITAVVGKAVLGQPMSLGEAWGSVRPLLGRLIGLALLVVVIVYGVFLGAVALGVAVVAAAGGVGAVVAVPLFVIGGLGAVYAYVRVALAPSVLVLERAGVRQSLRRSGVLVKGDWWRVFGILLLVFVIALFVSSVLQAPFQIGSVLGEFSGDIEPVSTADVLLQSVGSAVALTLVAPFEAAVGALLYVDRRIRAEALDVTLTAAAAGPRPT